MTQSSQDQKAHSATNICSFADDHRLINQIFPTDQVEKLNVETQGDVKGNVDHDATPITPTHKAVRPRSSELDFRRMRAVAWAADMYDICGGDGENNAYLGDGVSITPDGHLVDD